mgnify:CR=1 FL=1
MAQQFGSLNIGVGLRYEHVKFDYYETGRLRDGQSKTYVLTADKENLKLNLLDKEGKTIHVVSRTK